MGVHEGDPDTQQGQQDSEKLRRQQAHLNFAASHQARHTARQEHSSSAGQDRADDQPSEESTLLFNHNFAAETKDITASLEKIVAERKSQSTAAGTGLSGARHAGSTNAGGASSNDVMDATEGIRDELNALVDRVKGLRKVTAEATLFLPVYDLRRAQEEVGKLLATVESTRAELAPRKKFAFRNKRKEGTGAKARGRPTVSSRTRESGGTGAEKEGEGEGQGLRHLKGQQVEVKSEDADKDKDFNLADLDNCTVTILHVLGTLRLRRLTRCRVVCGAVRGPIYVEACTDCVIVAAGRQLRIHDSQRVDFYVTVSSGPIIEDCSGLRFAPSGLEYPQYHAHLKDAGLSDVANAWEDVKDFKWHRAQQSPNWGIIPQGDRESDPLAKATLN
eukprot:jgi/Undpi1/8885/HiC_scaffold_25.g11347.m1